MLIVNEFPPEKIAGTAMATQALAEQLTAKGHQVCVVVTTTCPKDKQSEIAPHDYTLIWMKTRPFRGLGWVWRITQAFQYVRRFQPEVIQGQAVSCGLMAGMLGRLLHIPSICYAQGYDVYQASGLQRKTEIRWGCALPNVCLAVTQNLEAAIHDVIHIPITLMPHAFVLPLLSSSRSNIRQSYGLNDGDKLMLNVARLEDFKGHDVLLRAWHACMREHSNAQLWIVGTGSLHEVLKDMVKQLGLQKNVRFLGFLPQYEVHALMAAADAFVLPSRSEPFGIVLLEAMAHGLPVVATDVGGIPEVLPEQGAVWQVPSDNEKALTDVMLKALQAGQYPCVRHKNYALEYTWDKQVVRFEALYQKLLQRDDV